MKEKTKGYPKYGFKYNINLVLLPVNVPQNLPQNSIFLEYPKLECLPLIVQVESSDLNDNFRLPLSFVTLGSKLTSSLKPLYNLKHLQHCIKIP